MAYGPNFFVAFVVVMLLVLYVFLPHLVLARSIEGFVFDLLFMCAFSAAYIGLTANMIRFVRVWLSFRRLLKGLSWSPLLDACRDWSVPDKKPVRLPLLDLRAAPPMFASLEFSAEYLDQVEGVAAQIGRITGGRFKRWRKRLGNYARNLEKNLNDCAQI